MPTSHGWGRAGASAPGGPRLSVLLEGDADASARGVFETLLGLAAEVVVLLEGDADASARGVFETLLGLAAEVVVRQAATGVARGEVWVYGSKRDPPTRQEHESRVGSCEREACQWALTQ